MKITRSNPGIWFYGITIWLMAHDVSIGQSAGAPLTPSYSIGYPWWPSSVSFADFDSDGWLDAFVHGANAYPMIFRNEQGTNFYEYMTLTNGPTGAAHGEQWSDVDQDGDLDLIVPAFYGDQLLYLNNGQNGFDLRFEFDVIEPVASAVGDFNNDGYPDVVVVSNRGYSTNKLFTNRGDGTFSASTPFPGPAAAVAWGDFDNDGDLDLAMAGGSDSVVFRPNSLFINNGDGTFTRSLQFGVGKNCWAMAWGDYDNDGDHDLALGVRDPYGGADAHNELWRNNGDGTFTKFVAFGEAGWQMAWADFDLDGDLDLAVSAYPQSRLYRNDGGGVFTEFVLSTDWHGAALAWVDIDSDGDADLVIADEIFLNHARNEPPWAAAGPDRFVECTSPSATAVQLDASGSSDPEGDPLDYEWYENSLLIATGKLAIVLLPLGTHTLTLKVNDGNGGIGTDEVIIRVEDTTSPAISSLMVDKPVLRTPNHRMVNVSVAYNVSDADPNITTTLSVTSNEPINGTGDGDTAPDWKLMSNHTIKLRAERAGTGSGRIYTVTLTATDGAGNSSNRSITVQVPHRRAVKSLVPQAAAVQN